MRKIVIVPALALVLGACAPDSWTKPGLNLADFNQDDASCTLGATSGPQPQAIQGGAAAGVANIAMAITNAAVEQNTYRLCMASRGYTRVVPTKQPTNDALAIKRADQEFIGKRYSDAMRLYRSIADNGNAYAQLAIGSMYYNGQGVPQDYARAMQWYRKSADEGNADAQKNLGGLYLNGLGAPKDYGQAMQWFRKAADQGNADGQDGVGFLYENGIGVPRDYAQAMQWYRKSADQGNANGQNGVGVLYANAWGVSADYTQAMEWYRKAAGKGMAQAQSNIGTLYAQGLGVQQDYGQARYWYNLAAAQGNESAKQRLATLPAAPAPQEVATVIEPSKQSTNEALALKQGDEAFNDKRYGDAIKFYRQAADEGNVVAQVNLGGMYENAEGVEQDYVLAAVLYESASVQSIGAEAFSANNRMHRVLDKMTSIQISRSQVVAIKCAQQDYKNCTDIDTTASLNSSR